MLHSRLQKRAKATTSMIRQSLDSSLFLFLVGIVGIFGLVVLLCVELQAWEVPSSVNDILPLNSKSSRKVGSFTREDSDARGENRPRFVFVMGLENSGHELLQELATMSPGLKRLQELDIHPSDTQVLGNLLYHKESDGQRQKELTREAIKNRKSLAKKKDKQDKLQRLDLKDPVQRSALMIQNKDHRRGLGTPSKMKLSQIQQSTAQIKYDVPSLWGSPCHKGNELHNLTNVEQDLIQILQSIEKKMNNASTKTTTTKTTPVNVLFNIIKSVDGGNNVLSYPYLATGDCRPLQYPSLDVWYDVCEKAGVLCSHIYIYRKDPYQILASLAQAKSSRSTNGDGATILRSIHLYTNMLNTMHVQMSLNANRSLGCIGLFDKEYKTNSNANQSWKDQVANLMGWTSPSSDYADIFEQAHNSRSFEVQQQRRRHQNEVMMAERNDLIVPSTIRSHFDSMAKANDMAREMCQRIVRRGSPQQ